MRKKSNALTFYDASKKMHFTSVEVDFMMYPFFLFSHLIDSLFRVKILNMNINIKKRNLFYIFWFQTKINLLIQSLQTRNNLVINGQ